MNWHLRGHYTAWEPGKRLAFTWAWDHEPATTPTTVDITFAPNPVGGTRLTLRYGPYAPTPAGATERQGHLEGWTHFLTRLQAV